MALVVRAEERQATIDIAPLERAKQRFLADLPDQQRHLFQTAGLENVYYTASNTLSEHCAKSHFSKSLAKIQPLMNALKQYGRALDVYANSSSIFMSPIWGSVRVLLAIASSATEYLDGLLNAFERVGRALPLFHAYEDLLKDDLHIMNLLVDAYTEVLGFCLEVKISFSRRQAFSCTLLILL